MHGFKKVKFITTFHDTLTECKDYPEKILNIEMFVPEKYCNDKTKVTEFIEKNTGFFVLIYENYDWLNT